MRKKFRLSTATLTLSCLLTALFAVILYSKFTHTQTQECANSVSCIDNLSGEYDPNAKEGKFEGQLVQIPDIANPKNDPTPLDVLGDASSKRIEVDLTNQMLYAIENEQVVYSFPVSTGLNDWTPTGDFHIWIKLRATLMAGGEGAYAYYLPNVPYTMYFYNDVTPKYLGYGIHGAYWHNDFGRPKSHGCVNLSPENARILYEWATPYTGGKHTTLATADNPGTLIRIYGDAPNY